MGAFKMPGLARLITLTLLYAGWPINPGAADPIAAGEADLAVKQGRISVTFVEVTLADAIEQVARAASFELERRGALDEPVTLTLEDEPLPRAVSKLLADHPQLMRFSGPAPAASGWHSRCVDDQEMDRA